MTLIICSLVLEHIENIDLIFHQASITLKHKGGFYLCELHPFKQIMGSRARFEQDNKLIELEYFVHHISEYFNCAKKHGLMCMKLNEWFDENNPKFPRLVSFLFIKE